MATLSAGYVFGATETVTNAKLASLVNDGSIASIIQSDLAASQGLVFTGTSAPSDTDQLWIDTNSSPPIARFYSTVFTNWVPVAEQAVLTNKSGQTGAAGRVLILDTGNSNSYTYTSTAGDTKFLGIETGSIANNATACVLTQGIGLTVNLELSASAGTYLRTSTATGKAEPVANTAGGIFGFLTESGTASARAKIFGINPNIASADQAGNYTWTGTHSFVSTVTINTASGTTTNWKPIVQMVSTMYTASAAGTTVLPFDDTIPQNTEGVEFMTQAITPKHSADILEIAGVWFGAGVAGKLTVALFQDTTADALAVVSSQTDGETDPITVPFNFRMAAGTTSSTTFKVRVGNNNAGTTVMNGGSGARLFGGKACSKISITEIKV